MKRTILISILSVFTIAGFAQQDAKAKEILEKVTKTTQSHASIEATFSFEMNNSAANIQEKSTGTIILKDKKYKLDIPQMGLQVICDGKSIWTYMVNSNEVSISNLDEGTDDLMDPSKIFTIYEHGFNYKFIGESTDAGIPVYSIDLIPQKPTGDVQKIRVMIDKQKMMIRNANITGKDGNSYHLTVNQFKTDGVFKDSDFVFDQKKYTDIEVIDMR
ncbi:MAG TPA: outer membrane lipoprotein carrier protein LolA [Prolixibacteraceae bacterium]|nr:outer membrane lipoprotein carrier protein LolA [Prolixibacteraceae bacterium]